MLTGSPFRNRYWYKGSVFYEIYIDLFNDSNNDGIGDIRGLINNFIYIKELGIGCLWLLPIYKSPLMDGGYDVSDYTSIRKEVGSLDDFQELIKVAHDNDIRIIMDLVLNHTSSQHHWFIASQDPSSKDFSKYKDYYLWDMTGDKYKDASVIFSDYEKTNWTYSPIRKEYYFHRFYKTQPDLNWRNEEVLQEFFKIISFWLDLGVDGFRVDAVPYLVKREGTTCENLKETHMILRKIRRFANKHYRNRNIVFLAEAGEPMNELVKYFGNGRNEFQMAFNFPLMPQIFLSLLDEDSKYIIDTIKSFPKIPRQTQWAIFLRNHDELSLSTVDQDTASLFYSKYDKDKIYRFNTGIAERLYTLLGDNKEKIALANSILLTLVGTPVLYSGDELDEKENFSMVPKDNVPYDRRLLVRTKIDWAKANKYIWDSQSTYNKLRNMLIIRKRYKDIFAHSDIHIINTGNNNIFAYLRVFHHKNLIFINNLSKKKQLIDTNNLGIFHFSVLIVERADVAGNIIELKPYSYIWVKVMTENQLIRNNLISKLSLFKRF